jgi:hypothetical protein
VEQQTGKIQRRIDFWLVTCIGTALTRTLAFINNISRHKFCKEKLLFCQGFARVSIDRTVQLFPTQLFTSRHFTQLVILLHA